MYDQISDKENLDNDYTKEFDSYDIPEIGSVTKSDDSKTFPDEIPRRENPNSM